MKTVVEVLQQQAQVIHVIAYSPTETEAVTPQALDPRPGSVPHKVTANELSHIASIGKSPTAMRPGFDLETTDLASAFFFFEGVSS